MLNDWLRKFSTCVSYLKELKNCNESGWESVASDSLLLLLENPQSLLLHSVFARPFAHLCHLVFVLAQLVVQRLDFLLDSFSSTVHLENNNKEIQFQLFRR